MAGGTVWVVVPDFDFDSYVPGLCSVSGLPRRSSDIGVFRPLAETGIIEGEGYFDMAQAAVEDACALLGWISPEKHEEETRSLREKLNKANLDKAQQARKIKRLEAQLAEATGVDPE